MIERPAGANRRTDELPVLTAGEAARAALEARAGGPAVALVTVVAVDPDDAGMEPSAGRRLMLDATGAARASLGGAALDTRALELARAALGRTLGPATHTLEIGGRRYTLYVEAHRAPDELLIVGAGHIAVPLARLGTLLGFRTTVLDDRPDFATTERFPEAAAVVRTDFTDPFRDVSIGPGTHVVLVTRAHKYDFDCLRLLLERPVQAAYIGMIGSRRRIRAAFHALLEAGVPRERVERVRAPVGLDIGAETPEEIAVSIAAELIHAQRAGVSAEHVPLALAKRERVLERYFPDTTR